MSIWNPDATVVRSHTYRGCELEVITFVRKMEQKGERWEANEIEFHPARNLFLKPYTCVVERID